VVDVGKPILGGCRCCGGKVSSQARSCPHCGQPRPFALETSAELPDWALRALKVLRAGNKIEAIKMVRAAAGYDLKKAKDLVDSWH
jgi:hypothetical protein